MNKVIRVANTFTDDMAVDCARLSFDSRADNHTPEQNAKLIDYLVRNEHVNPFFHGMKSIFIPRKTLFTQGLLQDKCALAGANIHMEDCGNWTVTASLWGWLNIAPYIDEPENIFALLADFCPITLDSYFKHNSLGFFSGDGAYEECLPPSHHQWFSFMFETDMCTKAQLYTHTVGLAKSSQSFRYIDTVKFYTPEEWRGKSENVKQGSSDEVVNEYTFGEYVNLLDLCDEWYFDNSHICNEQRRLILPQSQMSKYVITGTRESWERVFRLRAAPEAQKEVRDLLPVIQEALETTWEIA